LPGPCFPIFGILWIKAIIANYDAAAIGLIADDSFGDSIHPFRTGWSKEGDPARASPIRAFQAVQLFEFVGHRVSIV
jgi:hypothetical protein